MPFAQFRINIPSVEVVLVTTWWTQVRSPLSFSSDESLTPQLAAPVCCSLLNGQWTVAFHRSASELCCSSCERELEQGRWRRQRNKGSSMNLRGGAADVLFSVWTLWCSWRGKCSIPLNIIVNIHEKFHVIYQTLIHLQQLHQYPHWWMLSSH